MNVNGHFARSVVCAVLLASSNLGCDKPVAPGPLVLTETPTTGAPSVAADVLDARYPAGSRVVLLKSPYERGAIESLSGALAAAGGAVVSADGRRIFFVGKKSRAEEWQVYAEDLAERRLQALTTMSGGAMNPLLLPNGNLSFVSPVPKTSATNSPPPALFSQAPGGNPQQLTFGSLRVGDATVLADGRILFVSEGTPSGRKFFTINNDGTELTAFAVLSPLTGHFRQLRQCADSRVLFLVAPTNDGLIPGGLAQCVRMARPFQSLAPLFPNFKAPVRSIQPAADGQLLVCAEHSGRGSAELYRLRPDSADLGAPLFASADWECGEAAEVTPRPWPMGRISTVDLTKQTGKILCLNANFSTDASLHPTTVATKIRILAEPSPGRVCSLGEAPIQTDGSFLAEVPADVPLGFESLDGSGAVLRRESPMLWVRPGENRACVGCHEPPNRAPHNHRPLAVSAPVPRLSLAEAKLALGKAD